MNALVQSQNQNQADNEENVMHEISKKSHVAKIIFVPNGDQIHIARINPNEREIHKLAPGFYSVEFDKQLGFFLRVMTLQEMPSRIYGDVTTRSNRILNTFNSRQSNTGVLLHGMKGTGKSLLSRQVCYDAVMKHGMPVLVIQQAYAGNDFSNFMESIEQPCVVNVDEFEKTYSRAEDTSAQDGLLSMMDGVSKQNKLWILTVNETKRVSEYMINRPGRLFYKFEYGVIPEDVVLEVCKDKGLSEQQIQNFMSMYFMINELTFDVLMAIIEESKRYDEMPTQAIKYLNVDIGGTNYLYHPKVVVTVDGKTMFEDEIHSFSPESEEYSFDQSRKGRGIFELMLAYNPEYHDEFLTHMEDEDSTEENFEPSLYDFTDYEIELVRIEGKRGVREYQFKGLLPQGTTGVYKDQPLPEIRLTVIPAKKKEIDKWKGFQAV